MSVSSDPVPGGRSRVVVVGAGIAGLAAAVRIADRRSDVDVLVLEAGDRVGGKLRRVEVGGISVDVGAEAMLARRPEGLAAISAAGLDDQLQHPLTTSALIFSAGRTHPLPARTLLGIPTDLTALAASGVLSETGLAQVAAEPTLPPLPPLTADVAVAELVGARLGREVVDRLVEPLLGGVYAGRAEDISLAAAIPALAQRLAANGGSLLSTATELVAAGAAHSRKPVFASLAGGLARLPETLAADPRIEVRLASTVRALRRTDRGYRLTVGATNNKVEIDADAIVLATPAGKTSQLLNEIVPAAAVELAGIQTASMVIVTLAYDSTLALPAGSGVLVPPTEGLAVKAMTFTSQKWPLDPSSAGTVLRASLGRAGDEHTIQRPDEELVATVRRELTGITGVDAAPIDVHVQRWGGALPQYAVGHLDRIARVRSAVARVPGLSVAGASYDGVGIPACIGSGWRAADQVLPALAPPAGPQPG